MGRNDAALLYEVNLALEDTGGVVVEPDDEAALHLQAGALHALDVIQQIALAVLVLAALGQALLIGRLDAHEHGIESGLRHEGHQLRVVGQVNRDLRREGNASLALLPLNERRQQLGLEPSLVPDEVVVHEEDASAPPLGIQSVQFGQDLHRALEPGPMTQQGVTLQKSQLYGQPREYWTHMEAYFLSRARRHSGTGVVSTSAKVSLAYTRLAQPWAKSSRNAAA